MTAKSIIVFLIPCCYPLSMARRSRYQKKPARRDVNSHRSSPRRSARRVSLSPRELQRPLSFVGNVIPDDRFFRPQRSHPRSLSVWGSLPAIDVTVRSTPHRRLYDHFQIESPRRVPLCQRRSQRRRVIFATGFGGSTRKRRVRRKSTSSLSC